jgi:hypothetical protein
MPDFILQANISNYKRLLLTETDTQKVATIRRLLAEEEAKFVDSEAKKPSTIK